MREHWCRSLSLLPACECAKAAEGWTVNKKAGSVGSPQDVQKAIRFSKFGPRTQRCPRGLARGLQDYFSVPIIRQKDPDMTASVV
jgi:hypothetical protein